MRHFCLCIFVWECLAVGLISSSPLLAQSVSTQEVKVKLQAKVSLHLGETTLGKVAAALSDQTGLIIQPSSYLRFHRLIVEIENQSAEDVLRTLAELNDWEWRETDEKHVLITRPPVNPPREIKELPTAVLTALPMDIRRYFGVGVAPETWLTTENKRAYPSSLIHEGVMTYVQQKLRQLTREREEKIWPNLLPEIPEGHLLIYKNWAEPLKENVLLSLFFAVMNEMKDDNSFSVLQNRLRPYQQDINKATIELHGGLQGWLDVGTHYIEGTSGIYVGFGMSLEGITKPIP